MKKIWNTLTKKGKVLLVLLVLFTITLPITIPFGRTVHYIVTHGEEIENFQPYTIEQCRKDYLKYIN